MIHESHFASMVFEIVNGAWTILSTYFVIWLVVHLRMEGRQRGIEGLGWLSLPLGMQVAVSLLVSDFGTALSRAVAWQWRLTTGGKVPLTHAETIFLVLGAAIAAVGILCQIRVFTRAYLGNWPWITVGLVTAAYILGSVAFR